MSSFRHRLVDQLADAEWLHPARARAWCRILVVVSVLAVLGWIGLSRNGIDPLGRPLGTDFASFWTASHLALSGYPAAAYDAVAHAASQNALFPQERLGYYAFFYPPVFLLLCLPLALLPYLWALTLWLLAGLTLWLSCLGRILPQRWALLPIIGFPAVLINAGHGQNAFLTAACLGWGMLLIQRHPFMAGLCMGVLVFKPHLLLAAPILLLSAQRWRVVLGAITSAVALTLVSWALLGGEAWKAFLSIAPLARETMEQGLVEPWKMPSVFAAARVLGTGLGAAYLMQALVALATYVLLWRVASRRPGGMAEGAVLAAATPLCSPFLLDYDLLCLSLPLAWVAAEAQRTGWLRWEKMVLLTAYVLPLVARSLAEQGLPPAPLVIVALLLKTARRALRTPPPIGQTRMQTTALVRNT
ncbi:glycosyltransferase family 87 protein [Methylobacterium iners]|uniref:DUF2029 domain-containing protein n=1 Tax=Methylobacterium iners TaxID=418707 RepID=A0ABQ4S180_9HYPH|nr:glycosyltransferase family 87 protein [Methylobacterium iners]GJD96876.1 hypothetical protein OCOJLMKI_4103 [Methylobacterium iners]